jgi:hypothetical protein
MMVNSRLPDRGLQPFQEVTVKMVVTEAIRFLKLASAEKETLQYFRDVDIDKITWACLFVLQAAEKYGGEIEGILDPLDTVDETTKLMTDKGISRRQATTIQARSKEAKRHHTSAGWDDGKEDFGDIDAAFQGFFSAFPNAVDWIYRRP